MGIRAILWDIDDTLLDFGRAEREALMEAFRAYGLDCPDAVAERYSAVNRRYWLALERGELTREELKAGRFLELFRLEGLPASVALRVARRYEECLGNYVYFLPGALETVLALQGRVLQYAASNGTASVQVRKLSLSGLDRIFNGVFISEQVGAEKPSKTFFDAVMEHIPPMDRKEVLMVGDSLTSDIRGAARYGLVSCWYNPAGALPPAADAPDYVIRRPEEVIEVLRREEQED